MFPDNSAHTVSCAAMVLLAEHRVPCRVVEESGGTANRTAGARATTARDDAAVAVGAGAVHIDGQVPQVAGTGDFVRISLRSLAVASGKERRISPRRRGGHREHYCEQRRGCPGNLSFRKVYSCHVLFNLVLTRQRHELLL